MHRIVLDLTRPSSMLNATMTTTQPTTHECQICERGMTAKKGLLAKHGYKRPGDGFLHGECFGAHRAAYPATDALVEYLAIISSMLSDALAFEARLSVAAPIFTREVTVYAPEMAKVQAEKRGRRTNDPYASFLLEFIPGVSEYASYTEFGYEKNLGYKRRDAHETSRRLLSEVRRIEARIAAASTRRSA